jgi:hypothetical protein
MQGIFEAIKYLYQQFILRDVVAYVAPGTILTACLLRVYLGSLEHAVDFMRSIPAIAYVPIYGLLFTMGLAVQNFGEMIKLLKDTVRKNEHERLDKLQQFHRAVLSHQVSHRMSNEYSEVLERTRERIDIKKYASGNIALATVMGALVIWVGKSFPTSAHWAILVIGAVLVISLIRANHVQAKNVAIWEEGAINNN